MVFDICIVGAGVAGLFAAYRLSEKKKKQKVIIVEVGRAAAKRRLQMTGYFGLLMNSDGKFYSNDIKNTASLIGIKKSKSLSKYVKSIIKQVSDCKNIKDTTPSKSMLKKIKKSGFKIQTNDLFQLYPKDIHALSRIIASKIEAAGYTSAMSFDNEALTITKQKNIFTIQTEKGEIQAKKVIFCVGRSGWRWAQEVFTNFGLVEEDDYARFGIRIEMPSHILKDFNGSNCKLYKPDVEIGPLSWSGCVVPEDHINMAIASFRSNEERWETDKVSFQLIANVRYPNEGCKQTQRIGELTWILANERIAKERISAILNKKSRVSIMSEYNWLSKYIKDLSAIIPEVMTKAYFHIPTIIPLPPGINIGTNLETELDNFYVAGETAGVMGLYAAAIMGCAAADAVSK